VSSKVRITAIPSVNDGLTLSNIQFAVPKRVGKVKKDDHEHAAEDAESELLLNQKGKAPVRRQSTLPPTPSAIIGSTKLVIKGNDSGSETGSDEEGGLLLDAKKPASTLEGKAPPTPARSVSPKTKRSSKRDEEDEDEDIDPGRAPGRIIGTTHPLKDFKKNISQGDVVTKAVEDLSMIVTEILLKPFASRRSDEMLECMKAMRKVCLEEDEVDAWNAFLQNLKTKCLSSKPKGNPGFWEKVREEGRTLSLLTEKEVKKYGGTSQYSEKQAVEVRLCL
jgi:ATP-dependent DNA helicase 2 subunit 2